MFREEGPGALKFHTSVQVKTGANHPDTRNLKPLLALTQPAIDAPEDTALNADAKAAPPIGAVF